MGVISRSIPFHFVWATLLYYCKYMHNVNYLYIFILSHRPYLSLPFYFYWNSLYCLWYYKVKLAYYKIICLFGEARFFRLWLQYTCYSKYRLLTNACLVTYREGIEDSKVRLMNHKKCNEWHIVEKCMIQNYCELLSEIVIKLNPLPLIK